MEPRHAGQAVLDAVQKLDQIAMTHDPGDIPWKAFYYSLGGVIAFVLTPNGTNSFMALDLLGQVARVVQGEGKAGNVDPGQVDRRYFEVYMALDTLLHDGGTKTSKDAMAEAKGTSDSLTTSKPTASRLGADKSGASANPAPSYPRQRRTLAGQAAVLASLTFSTETLAGQAAVLASLSFSTEWVLKDAQPVPAFKLRNHEKAASTQAQPALGHQPGAPAGPVDPFAMSGTHGAPAGPVDPFAMSGTPGMPTGPVDPFAMSGTHRAPAGPVDPFAMSGAPGAPAGPVDPFAMSGAGGDLLSGLMAGSTAKGAATTQGNAPSPTKGDPFADIFPPVGSLAAAVAAAPAEWNSFDGASGVGAAAAAAGGANQASRATPPVVVVVKKPSRELLQLHEMWRAEAVGQKVVRAGMDGRVSWVQDASSEKARRTGAQGRCVGDPDAYPPTHPGNRPCHLSPSAAPPLPIRLHMSYCPEPMPDGQVPLVAFCRPAPPLPICLHISYCPEPMPDGQMYHLSPSAAPPLPIRLHISYCPEPMPDGQMLVTFDLQLAAPSRAAPTKYQAQFDRTSRTMRWQLPAQQLQGSSESLAVVFVVSAGIQAATVAAAQAVAVATLKGNQGQTLTGIKLYQSLEPPLSAATKASWEAVVTARPPRT
eukprot:gene26151-11874_t